MTRTTNARIAGFTYLFYIAVAFPAMVLFAKATHGEGTAAKLDTPIVAATFFAVGSAFFSWLLLRGRMIPVPLAWLGVVGSILLVVGLPLQLAGILHGTITQLMWLPMAAFEIPLGFWLLIKGVPHIGSS